MSETTPEDLFRAAASMRRAAEEITRLRASLATAEAERDAAHNDALEKAKRVAYREAASATGCNPVTLAQRIGDTINALKKGTRNG